MTTTNPIRNRPSTNSQLLLHDASLTFAAGAFGGLLNSLTVWIFGEIGITGLLGVKIAPAFTPAWLYPRIVWGGLWGFLFLLSLPFLARKSAWIQGLVLSLVPSLVQLLLVFPVKDGKGFLGLGLGLLTPLFVLLFNAVWGVGTAFLLHWINRNSYPSEFDVNQLL